METYQFDTACAALSVFGSSNLDWPSTVLNKEIDTAQSTPITPERWARRGLGERASEVWARLVEQEL